MRSRDLLRCGRGPAAVVRVAHEDLRVQVGSLLSALEERTRQVCATVVRRVGVVVDGQPLLIVEEGLDSTSALHYRARPPPGPPAVPGSAHRDVALTGIRAAKTCGVLQLGHQNNPVLAIEGRRGVARAVAALHRDLSVDPGFSSVERGEETRRHYRLPGASGVVEAVIVVVRPRDQVLRISRVYGYGKFVIRSVVLPQRGRSGASVLV